MNEIIVRDVVHEQVSGSTDAQLVERMAALTARYERGYPMPQLAEYHAIRSEQYCRATGKQSQPWVTWSPGVHWTMDSPRMSFDFSLGEGRAVQQAAEEAAEDRHGTALSSLPEVTQAALLKEAADAYDGAAGAAYDRQQERNFTKYWEG